MRDLKNKDVARIFALSILLGFIFLALLSLASAQTSTICTLSVNLVNQDPYPAIPNDYVSLVFQVSGVNSAKCTGARFELLPSYPFSSDEGNLARSLGGNTWISEYKNDWIVPYKVRVDKDALNGIAQIEVAYSTAGSDTASYIHKKFNVTIEDSRTSFDAVIQEVSGSDVSIAIANAGKNTANSVVIRIPEQDYFSTAGTSGQMVGNLESGDYTIVSFELSRTGTQGLPSEQNNNSRQNGGFFQQQASQESPLKFDIYYTDSLGTRRTVNMELPVKMSNTNSSMLAIFGGNNMQRRNTSIWSSWYIIVPVILVIIAIAVFLIHKKREHAKMISRTHSKEMPDWINKKDRKK